MTEAWHDLVQFLLTHVRQRCISNAWILFALVVNDLAIAWVYLWIPRMLRRVIRSAGGDRITGARQIKGFAHFVGACGVSHVLGVVVLFVPILDWGRVGWLAWTAVISWQTAIFLKRAESTVVEALKSRQSLEVKLGNGTPANGPTG